MPVSLRVTLNPPFTKIRAKHQAAHKKTLERQREEVRQLGRDWVMLNRQEAPERKGRFKKSIIYRTFNQGEGIVIMRGYFAKPLGDWIIGGTKPHIIRAVNKKALKFLWPNGPGSTSAFVGYHFYKALITRELSQTTFWEGR